MQEYNEVEQQAIQKIKEMNRRTELLDAIHGKGQPVPAFEVSLMILALVLAIVSANIHIAISVGLIAMIMFVYTSMIEKRFDLRFNALCDLLDVENLQNSPADE